MSFSSEIFLRRSLVWVFLTICIVMPVYLIIFSLTGFYLINARAFGVILIAEPLFLSLLVGLIDKSGVNCRFCLRNLPAMVFLLLNACTLFSMWGSSPIWLLLVIFLGQLAVHTKLSITLNSKIVYSGPMSISLQTFSEMKKILVESVNGSMKVLLVFLSVVIILSVLRAMIASSRTEIPILPAAVLTIINKLFKEIASIRYADLLVTLTYLSALSFINGVVHLFFHMALFYRADLDTIASKLGLVNEENQQLNGVEVMIRTLYEYFLSGVSSPELVRLCSHNGIYTVWRESSTADAVEFPIGVQAVSLGKRIAEIYDSSVLAGIVYDEDYHCGYDSAVVLPQTIISKFLREFGSKSSVLLLLVLDQCSRYFEIVRGRGIDTYKSARSYVFRNAEVLVVIVMSLTGFLDSFSIQLGLSLLSVYGVDGFYANGNPKYDNCFAVENFSKSSAQLTVETVNLRDPFSPIELGGSKARGSSLLSSGSTDGFSGRLDTPKFSEFVKFLSGKQKAREQMQRSCANRSVISKFITRICNSCCLLFHCCRRYLMAWLNPGVVSDASQGTVSQIWEKSCNPAYLYILRCCIRVLSAILTIGLVEDIPVIPKPNALIGPAASKSPAVQSYDGQYSYAFLPLILKSLIRFDFILRYYLEMYCDAYYLIGANGNKRVNEHKTGRSFDGGNIRLLRSKALDKLPELSSFLKEVDEVFRGIFASYSDILFRGVSSSVSSNKSVVVPNTSLLDCLTSDEWNFIIEKQKSFICVDK